MVCEAASATGALPVAPERSRCRRRCWCNVIAPIVDEAVSLVVVMTSLLVLSRLADRLLAASAVFKSASDVVAVKVNAECRMASGSRDSQNVAGLEDRCRQRGRPRCRPSAVELTVDLVV